MFTLKIESNKSHDTNIIYYINLSWKLLSPLVSWFNGLRICDDLLLPTCWHRKNKNSEYEGIKSNKNLDFYSLAGSLCEDQLMNIPFTKNTYRGHSTPFWVKS